jgi:site-specific DNA recombinase
MERLTEAYLGGIIRMAEYQRRRRELDTRDAGLEQQSKELGAQVDRQNEISQMAASIEEFCHRVQSGLATASFVQKRTLLELLVDRVLVINDQVEIRYVVPTHPRGETTRFCHLRKDYFHYVV